MKAEAKELYDEAVVVDGLNVSNWESDKVFVDLAAGGVAAINATVVTWENFQQTMDHITAWMKRFRERPDILQVRCLDDIHKAKASNRTGIILGFQNSTAIENDLDRLCLFHALGVRIIQLTFHERNLLASGCWERADDGLSNFGVDAVREMNDLGILIDLSHVGDRSVIEAIETSDKPCAITHANARAIFDHPRNRTEESLKLLAERGGVVGACSFCPFLPTAFESTVTDFIDAVDDMIQRVGIDHVGIGTDNTQEQPLSFWHYIAAQQGTKFPSTFADGSVPYAELSFQPIGMETPAKFPVMAEALLDRGYARDDALKILGGNWLRLFKEVWQS